MSRLRKQKVEFLRTLLEEAYLRYAVKDFIQDDPVRFIYRFEKKEDKEIAGLFAALMAWGKRSIILNKVDELLQRMDESPYEFVMAPGKQKYQALKGFVHRTFQETDIIGLASGLREIYTHYGGLESVFSVPYSEEHSEGLQSWRGIQYFRDILVTHPEFLSRSYKHVSNPGASSSAKRLHLFLRWMVRKDAVDAGLWKGFPMSELSCPLDVHTGRVGRQLGLLNRKQDDRQAVEELTASLRILCPEDPVRYDLALFGIGVYEGY
jgi:uncharacterized protein (TIGR02757 family)